MGRPLNTLECHSNNEASGETAALPDGSYSSAGELSAP